MPIPRRVLMTTDAVGGVWTYALDLSRGLAARGIEIGLATMGPPPSPAQRREAAAIPGLDLFESTYRLEWMDDPWDDVARAGRWLLELEQQYCPELIHLNNYCHGALPFAAPVVMVGHSCVLSWWRAVHGTDAPAEWTRYRSEVRRGLAAASLVLAPTTAMLRALDEYYGPLPAARVCPNGRPAPAQNPPASPKQHFVFTAGRLWDEAKNLAAVEAAAPSLPWPVFVAGDPQHPTRRQACTGAACRYLGRLTPRQMAWWLDRASIYVLPARYEPFGLSILEAALSGCALVLGNIPSLREIWADAALYVSPHDPAALAATLRRLIETPAERIDLAARAHARAQEFTLDRMLASCLEAYATATAR